MSDSSASWKSPEYRAWINMKSRCNTPSATGYKYYGGRGIRVCAEWQNSFATFLADMGPRPSADHSLDRIDSNGDYCPANCRWSTQTVQMRNRRCNHLVVHNGRAIPIVEAAAAVSLPANTIIYRLRRGWSEEQALSLPQRKGRKP